MLTVVKNSSLWRDSRCRRQGFLCFSGRSFNQIVLSMLPKIFGREAEKILRSSPRTEGRYGPELGGMQLSSTTKTKDSCPFRCWVRMESTISSVCLRYHN